MIRPRSLFLPAGILIFAAYFIIDRYFTPVSNRAAILWMALAAALIVVGEIIERRGQKGGKKD